MKFLIRKNNKISKPLAVLFAVVLITVCSVPVFANAFRPTTAYNYLNLYGNSGINQRVLTLYSQYNGPDQQFAFTAYKIEGTGRMADYLFNNSHHQHAVNRRSTDARAFMYFLDSSSAKDSAFNLVDYNQSIAYYKLMFYNEYLCAVGDSNGSGVYFKSPSAYTPTQWYLQPWW